MECTRSALLDLIGFFASVISSVFMTLFFLVWEHFPPPFANCTNKIITTIHRFAHDFCKCIFEGLWKAAEIKSLFQDSFRLPCINFSRQQKYWENSPLVAM